MLQRSRHTLLAIWNQESGLYIRPRKRLQALRFTGFDGAVFSAANITKLQSSLYTFPISCVLAGSLVQRSKSLFAVFSHLS